jgi:enamine deaminase RidA (YjgF/YER057c/UK114 family)
MRSMTPIQSEWNEILGYSRAVRVGSIISVSATAATGPGGEALLPGQPGPQARIILERIGAALHSLGATYTDVIETRIYVTDIDKWEEVGRVHGEVFGVIRPAMTMVEVKRLTDPGLAVEISALAVVNPDVQAVT